MIIVHFVGVREMEEVGHFYFLDSSETQSLYRDKANVTKLQ